MFTTLLELEVFHRINQHLQVHILSDDQFGFRKELSTFNAIYKLIDSKLKSWNNKMYASGFMMSKLSYITNTDILNIVYLPHFQSLIN
jgi:hypothetical protein